MTQERPRRHNEQGLQNQFPKVIWQSVLSVCFLSQLQWERSEFHNCNTTVSSSLSEFPLAAVSIYFTSFSLVGGSFGWNELKKRVGQE